VNNLTAHYTIGYQPAVPAAAALVIRIQSKDGWAETTMPVPAP
jgi:hypothetical protein